MKKAIIIPNPIKDESFAVTAEIVRRLIKLKIDSFIEEKYKNNSISEVSYYQVPPCDADIIIVVGGDGSVIDASSLAVELGIPILAVNLGKVGYLAQLEPDRLDMLDRLAGGEYKTEEKMLLEVEKISTGTEAQRCSRLALNDVVVSHENYLGISDIMIENEHGDHVNYRADGVIASTPAGSTAYSLSAGGPIVSQDIDAIVATPICPHSFFNRSIVFNASEKIRLCNTGKSALKICIDGRLFLDLEPNEACTVLRADKELKMLTFAENNMFATLFGKMKKIENI